MTQQSASKAKHLHSQNGRQRPLPRNLRRDAYQIRSLWYDNGIRMAGLLRRFEAHGWSQSAIEDVVFYRTYKSLQKQDILWSIRESNF